VFNANFSNISAMSCREHWYRTWTNTIVYALHAKFIVIWLWSQWS